MKILFCQLLLAEISLNQPYVLSFATVDKIKPVIVRLTLENGSTGIAEAVALPGYSHETTESLIFDLKMVLHDLPTMKTEEVASFLKNKIPNSPFAVSAILTALEFAEQEFCFEKDYSIPLVAPVSTEKNHQAVLTKALQLYKHGYRTIKLKVGRDIRHDCASLSTLLDEMPEPVKIRIDANQGYSFEQACRLLETLQHQRNHLVECFEQPFGINDWLKFQDFSKLSKHVVPLMIDESIINEEDVEKAADVGADLIKLKLFKHQGIKGLIALVTKAKNLGLEVIFGNGVASEIGNMAEAVAFKQGKLFVGAFEGNGFEKLSTHIMVNPPTEIDGNLRWRNNPQLVEPLEIKKDCVHIFQEVGRNPV